MRSTACTHNMTDVVVLAVDMFLLMVDSNVLVAALSTV